MTDSIPSAHRRIVALDVIRGVAVMGIFSVNVVAMAMIMPAYFYPPSYGLESAWDAALWAVNFVLIEGKMRSLFSMLFGASILLVIERAEAAGRSAAVTHYARMAVLLAIGLAHFYFIWWGDILAVYAVVGMAAYFCRRLAAPGLLALSMIAFALDYVPAAMNAPSRLADQAAAQAPGASEDAVEAWAARTDWIDVTPEEIAADRAYHRSPLTYAQEMTGERRWEPLQALDALWFETLALMLLGMAAYRCGFLTGGWSDRAYRRVAVGGLSVGAIGFSVLAGWALASGLAAGQTLAAYFDLSGPFRPVMALGYAALIVLLFRRPGALRARLAAVGRCAFTNYLGASLVGMLVFFDTGLGLYGDLSRAEAWLLVPIVWAIMLLWSKPWLEHFRHGPLEWLWRSLARWQVQPMRRRRPSES